MEKVPGLSTLPEKEVELVVVGVLAVVFLHGDCKRIYILISFEKD